MLWNKFLQTLLDLRTHFGRNGQAQKYAGDEPPLRSELFSSDQMMRHGKALADSHQLSSGGVADRLLARLADNESILIESLKLLTEAVQANCRITPAGEWLIDNFYLIEKQIRMARHRHRGSMCWPIRPLIPFYQRGAVPYT